MAFRLRQGERPPSNKAPAPVPPPHKSRYPIQGCDIDQNPFWVSVPQPDMLSLVGLVRPDCFIGGLSDHSISGLAPSVMKALSAAGASHPSLVQIGPTKFYVSSGTYTSVTWRFGQDQCAINFTTGKQETPDASHWLRIELNPRKLGPAGICDLLDTIHAATGKRFRVGTFLNGCHVTRVDVAVDVVGLSVREMIVTGKNTGKRVHYHGVDGGLESLYLHRKVQTNTSNEVKPSSRKLGVLIARVYDRRREMIASGLEPDFGQSDVTRVEIVKTKFGNKKRPLTDLAGLKNPFADLFVGQATTASPGNLWSWLEYVELRRSVPHLQAAEMLGLSANEAKVWELAHLNHPRDVLESAEIWSHWNDGLSFTGTDILIGAATAKSANSTF